MNNTEAIEILKRQSACEKAECFNECADCPNNVPDDEFITALDTVISAMEKKEAYNCSSCEYEGLFDDDELPCKDCRRTYGDYWRKKSE